MFCCLNDIFEITRYSSIVLIEKLRGVVWAEMLGMTI